MKIGRQASIVAMNRCRAMENKSVEQHPPERTEVSDADLHIAKCSKSLFNEGQIFTFGRFAIFV
jgi:hypothetical protein